MSYTAQNPYTTSWTFQNVVSGDLSFSSIVANEVDYGGFYSFTDNELNSYANTLLGLDGMQWSGYKFGVYGPNSSTTITLTFDVDATPGETITSLEQTYQVDYDQGPGTSASATESVYASGTLVGSTTWTLGDGSTSSVNLTAGYQNLQVVLTINESINSSGISGSLLNESLLEISVMGEYYGQTPQTQLSAITGSVFCDTYGTGVYQPSDMSMSGVTVDLLNNSGSVVASTITAANGTYTFSNLVAGTYTTEVIAPAGDNITTSNQGQDRVVLTQGTTISGAATGLDMPGVWSTNVDYDQNGTEINLPGATVTLLTNSGTVVGSEITNANGNVTFNNLTVGGTYMVEVTTPGDTVVTSSNVNTADEVLSCGTITSTETVTANNVGSFTPAVEIVKSVTSVGGALGDPAATYAGEAIDYQVVVTNTGNETLTNVVVTDPTLGTTLASLASLAAGASVTYTVSTTVTQAEIDSGNAVPNTAVVTDDQTPSQSSTVTTWVAQSPAVTIVKSVSSVGGASGDPAATYAGEAIDYQVVVANTGNETLTNVVVTDPTLGTTLASLASLAVGASVTYSASTTVTQAEIDSGNAVPNTAVVTDSQTASQSSTVTTPVAQSPAVTIVKSVTSVGGAPGDPAATYAGEAIDYQVVVANTGNETLTNVVVTDPTLGTTLASLASLAVGASVTYSTSTTVTQAEIDSGNTVPNTVVVTDDQTPSQSSTVTTPVAQSPAVTIMKSVTSVGGASGDPAATYAGEAIDYQVVVANTGNETLTNVAVIDSTLGTTLGSLASLAVSASVTYTAAQTVTQAEIDSGTAVPNTAVVMDSETPSQSSTVTTPISQSPAVSIVKTVTSVGGASGDPAATYAGELIDYKLVVTNTGNETLTNVLVTDATLNTTLGSLASLAVGASVTYTAVQTVTQAEINAGGSVPNTAVVMDSQTPSQSSTVTTPVSQSPDVSIVKSVTSVGGASGDPAATYAGELIDYQVVVANTGNETLTNVLVTDATLGATLGSLASLAVGANVTYTAVQTVTQAEINAGGSVANTAVVTDSQTLSQSSTATTPISQSPGVSIVKTVMSVGGVSGDPAATYAGEAIDYQIVVTNTGDETLTNVLVTDTTLGTTLGTIASLAAGATVAYTAVQTVTQAEINSDNSITNTATVTDSQTPSQSSTASTIVSQAPAVAIVKTVTSVGGVSGDPTATYAGELIDYKVVVSNTGNETLTNVLVTDQTLGTTLGTLASLAVGASVTYTAFQTVSSAELSSGNSIPNTAVVTDAQTPSQASTVTTQVAPSPSVSIVKTVTSVGGVVGDPAATYAGEVIDYKIVVSNTGNETLTNVVVKDSTLGTTLGTLASLAAGASVTYTAAQTVSQADLNQILGSTIGCGGSVTHTASGSGLGSGCTAWLSSSFNPTSCANGATYTFSGITCTISGAGVGGSPFVEQCPNAVITFSSSCTQATTTYNSSTNCWVTTLPANCSPGSVFLSGLPFTVPSGCNLNNCSITWSIGQSTNNCGASSVSWDTSCAGFNSFNQNGCNGLSNYNQIGVQSCDNLGGYNFGSYGTCAGTPLNQYTYGNCSDDCFLQSCSSGNSCGSIGTCVCTPAPTNVSGSSVINTATVTDSQNVSGSSTASTAVTGSPAVSIVKTVTSVGGVSGDPAATYAGEVIDYQILVTNTGDETLSNVLVTDPTLGTTLGTIASLAAGASVTYTAAQTVTAAEISSGNPISNTATVTDAQTPSQSSTVSTSITHPPAVSIVKTVTSVGGVSGDPSATYAGEVIDYNIVVTNTGGTTLTNVVVKDSTLGTTLGTLASLAAGASVTYTAAQTVTQADLNQVLGTTTGSGGCVTHTAPSSGLGSGCIAWLSSSFNPTSCANGATYTFTGVTCTISGSGIGGSLVEQCPNAVITFSNSCSQATTTFNSSTNCWVTTLPANCSPGSVFLSGLPFAVPSGCNLSNCSITWSIGQSSNNCGSPSIGWDTTCTAFNSFDQNGCNGLSDYNQIGVQSCDNLGGYDYGNDSTCAGTPLNQYTYGNCGVGSFIQSGNNNSCGDSGTLVCTPPQSNVSGSSVINTATVTDSQNVTGSSTASTAITAVPNVSIVKTVTSVGGVSGDPSATYADETIDYQIVVTNTGDEALTNVIVTDATVGTTLGTIASLAAGASAIYAAAVAVTQAEIDNGSAIANTATVTDSQAVSASSTASTGVTKLPGISIVKSVTSVGGVAGDPVATHAGEVIDYSVVVTNTGNETLTNVLVKDTTLGTTLGTLASLAAGASVTYTAAQTVTSAELSGCGPVTNTATVTDSQTAAQSSTASTATTQISSVAIGGSTPTGSLSSLYGTAQQIEFTYNPSDTVSLKQIQAGLASASGNNTNAMAFMEISNSSNPYSASATIYYEGAVQAGQEVYANATFNPITDAASPNNHFSTTNGADTYAYVFASQAAFQSDAAPIQTMVYNTSGSQAMHLGDQIGSLTVAGYIGANGGHVTA